jgi:predicted metal-dependent hydrolase
MNDLFLIVVRLFNNGEFFACHEALEEAWMHERGPHRVFLQALIHLAVGLYHLQRGKTIGATRQLRKGLDKLSPYLPVCDGIDTALLHRDASQALERIQVGETLSAYPHIHMETQNAAR